MKLKPPTLLRSKRARALVAVTVAIAGFSSLAIAQTTTVAYADPTETLVAVGSDTVQDVYNQFAIDLNGNELGSYNAVDPNTQVAGGTIDPVEISQNGTNSNPNNAFSCSFTRPNGSGNGISALRDSLNPGSAVVAGSKNVLTGSAIPQTNCVDIARSSSSVAQDTEANGTSNQSNTGPIVYIPFAIDAVAGATGPASAAGDPTYSYSYTGQTDSTVHTVTVTPVSTNITHADDFTLVNLMNLYKNCLPVVVDGVTYDPTGATGQAIDLYVPQSGSGTAKFWASTLGFSLTSLPTCVHQVLVGPLAGATGGIPVEEHNGTPMTSDPNGFGPFSAAQWISQRNGHADRRHFALVHSLINCTSVVNTTVPATGTCGAAGTGTSPFGTGGAATGGLNANFPIVREVFSVASFARVSSATDPLSSLLNAADGSFICGEQSMILSYGFAIDPNCGTVIAGNRALD